jgi:hypothetical protein
VRLHQPSERKKILFADKQDLPLDVYHRPPDSGDVQYKSRAICSHAHGWWPVGEDSRDLVAIEAHQKRGCVHPARLLPFPTRPLAAPSRALTSLGGFARALSARAHFFVAGFSLGCRALRLGLSAQGGWLRRRVVFVGEKKRDQFVVSRSAFVFSQRGLLATGEWDPHFDRMGACEGVFSGKVGVMFEG